MAKKGNVYQWKEVIYYTFSQLYFCGCLGLSYSLIRHKNAAFLKRSSNRGNLKTPAFRFRVDRKTIEDEHEFIDFSEPQLNTIQTSQRRIYRGKRIVIYHLLTKSEVITGKSQTEALMY